MEVAHKILGSVQVVGGLPGLVFVVVTVKSFPVNKVIKLTAFELGVKDLTDGLFLAVLEGNGLGRRLALSGDIVQ